jgi:hypothetical protein
VRTQGRRREESEIPGDSLQRSATGGAGGTHYFISFHFAKPVPAGWTRQVVPTHSAGRRAFEPTGDASQLHHSPLGLRLSLHRPFPMKREGADKQDQSESGG